MLQVVNEFHNAQFDNDKTIIDNLLADNFLETGAKYAVQTPDVIYKKDLVNYDYSKVHVESIKARYLLILNMFSNSSTSLSFVREIKLPKSSDFPRFYVTCTFEKHTDGLKIIKAERKLCF